LRQNGVLLFYSDPARSPVIDLIKKIRTDTEMGVECNEAYQLFMLAKATQKIPGEMAEVGVWKGATAKLICEGKGGRTLHCFDRFEDGLPKLSEFDTPKFYKGQFKSSFDDVSNLLRPYQHVYLHKGSFPETADPVKDRRFCFVNLDVDLYEPTRDSLAFFYPRMSRGGIIVSHDYINSPGVRKAVDEFFVGKPETVIELSGSQCMIVKL
jgi:O-methyltransferase